jgi:hypothetical protein
MKNFIFKMLESEKNRSSKTLKAYGSLDSCLKDSKMDLVRPNSLHIQEFLKSNLANLTKDIEFNDYKIEINIGRKGKANSVRLDAVDKTNKTVRVVCSQTQTSYRRLKSMTSLLVTLLEVFFIGTTYKDADNNLITYKGALKLPSGAPKKRDKNELILSHLGISGFQGMDSSSIVTAFTCDKCGIGYTACNLPKVAKECFKPDCSGSMIGVRMNYNHRSDNLTTHWGVNSEAVLMGLNPHDPALRFSSGKVKELIYSSMNWSVEKVATSQELESALIESQGVDKKASEQVIATLSVANLKGDLKVFLDGLLSEQPDFFRVHKLSRKKLATFHKEETEKLADILKIKLQGEFTKNADRTAYVVKNG